MSFLVIALAVTMITVVIVLITGIISMTRGGEFNRKYGNRLMRARVILQGIAIALFLMVLWGSAKR